MHNRIKRVIAATLVFGTISSVIPNNYFYQFAVKAYASDNKEEKYGIDRLEIIKGDYTSKDDQDYDDYKLNMYTSNSYTESTPFEEKQQEYYVRTTSPTIKINVNKVDGCTYKIFRQGSSTQYSSADELELKSGDNIFYVRTYNKHDFDEKNVQQNQINYYIVHVQRNNSSNIYLKDISLSDGDISFSKNTTSYNIEVKADVDEINIQAKPEDLDYGVDIDGYKVSDNENFKRKVSLNSGKNEIKIVVGDDNKINKVYTLNIYRGTKPTANTSTVEYGPIDNSQPSVYLDDLQLNSGDIKLDFRKDISVYNVKVDSSIDAMDVTATPKDSACKVEVNNRTVNFENDYRASLKNLATGKNTFTIKVTDKDGNARNYTLNIFRGVNIPSTTTSINTTQTSIEVKKNQWVSENSKWYFMDENGKRKTGWYKNAAGTWYLLGNDGAMLIGWQKANDVWYYFNEANGAGNMLTGWFKDTTGTWYYADENGHMLHDTVIGGYTLSSSGAMI